MSLKEIRLFLFFHRDKDEKRHEKNEYENIQVTEATGGRKVHASMSVTRLFFSFLKIMLIN